MNTLLALIADTERVGNQHGGEWHAPRCPRCGKGDDRLVVWPYHEKCNGGKVWCRRCEYSCDGLEYARNHQGMSWTEACEFFGIAPDKILADGSYSRPSTTPVSKTEKRSRSQPGSSNTNGASDWRSYSPPDERWREAARGFAVRSRRHLWEDTRDAKIAREYLYQRGLTADTIEKAGLGFNPKEQYLEQTAWGLPSVGKKIWLPQGIVIPWFDGEGISNVNVRRLPKDVEPSSDKPWKQRKYQRVPGPSAPLYGVQWIRDDKPAMIVEGEFDALAVQQEAADLVVPVATGSTGGARREEWLRILSNVPVVLVAFDSEKAGEEASRTWISSLPNATRWHPHANDASEMREMGKDVRIWVQIGLHERPWLDEIF